jgi:hypothetical protein
VEYQLVGIIYQPAGISQEARIATLFDGDASRLLESRRVNEPVARKKKPQQKNLTVADMAKMGGKARMAGLTREERAELGRLAARARWSKAKAGKKSLENKAHNPDGQ